jgi:crotonobetainyl-CoA:carnitine CoA-transferase CaiB-like acyl-CoA transferase
MLYITPPVTLERTPGQVVAPAPNWGEHTDEVLREAGYTPGEIEGFHAQGVV